MDSAPEAEPKTRSKKIKSTDDVLLILCEAVKNTLSTSIGRRIDYSPVVQRITKTCLKPDLGCFVLFDGGFSGLVVMNFTARAAMEVYTHYMLAMGMPQDELAKQHTADEVANTLGELMNQIIGKFQADLQHHLLVSVNQSQPKMLVLNKELVLSVNAKLDQPQSRKVTFLTEHHNPFYIEMSMEKTEFVELFDTERPQLLDLDQIIDSGGAMPVEHQAPKGDTNQDDLLAELGL